jgi:hypothetical protein
MRCSRITAPAVLLVACIPLSAQTISTVDETLKASKISSPISSAALFVENRGQFDPGTRYKLTTRTGVIWLTGTGVLFDGGSDGNAGGVGLRGSAVASPAKFAVPGGGLGGPGRIGLESRAPERVLFSEAFAGPNVNVMLEPSALSADIYNYFNSADPARVWLSAGAFSSVDYNDVWPGISVRLKGNSTGIERQFIVQPGADAGNIAMSYRGASSKTIDAQGSLVFATALGTIQAGVPYIYQEVDGVRIPVTGQYRLTGLGTYGFQIDTYAREYPLVVSSTMDYSHEKPDTTAPPVVTFFNVAPTATLSGQAAIGTVSVAGATSATVNGLEASCISSVCTGTFMFYPTSTTDYVLQASGLGGNTTASQEVEVGQYQSNPPPQPAGLQVTWGGACWLKGYPKSYCNGACQGMSFTVNTPTPLPLEATLYLGTPTCNPAMQDNLNDDGTLTGSGGWIWWFIHHPNQIHTSAIWTIGNQSSGCVNYAKAPACP